MEIIGTNHFPTFHHALTYYKDYGYDAQDVKAKLDAGEIALGDPALMPGDKIVMLDNHLRYGIRRQPSGARNSTEWGWVNV